MIATVAKEYASAAPGPSAQAKEAKPAAVFAAAPVTCHETYNRAVAVQVLARRQPIQPNEGLTLEMT